jgi:hypothetical protein
MALQALAQIEDPEPFSALIALGCIIRGETYHFGRAHELCYEKNSELPESNPRRKMKGRVVFLGDQVRDQDGNAAMFQELASTPATMAASKFADYYGLRPGNVLQTADVTSAYLQALPKDTPTWVELPYHRWPQDWKDKFRPEDRPCCPLVMALYGHPRVGGHWERHCDEKVRLTGFEKAAAITAALPYF